MQTNFDYFGQIELPYLILTNPDKTEIFSLGLAYETKLSKKFNTLSEFTFLFPKSIDGGINEIEAYQYIKNKRLVKLEGFGYFQITNAVENSEGEVPIMSVECKALECELIQKRLTNYGGTIKLYDIIEPDGTILQDMIELAPNYSVGTISAELLTKYRTFDVSDTNIYNFLMVDVAGAFECIFVFDTDTRTINAYSIDEATSETDIFLSFENVISSAEFSEKSDEITTALSVYGNGNLSINLVNPLGTNYIYNFDYFKNTTWMSQGLITAIDDWKTLIDSNQTSYANGLTLLSTYNSELLVLQSQLAVFNSEYLALEGIQKTRIQQNLPFTDVTVLLVAKQSQITAQEILITNKETQISDVTSDLLDINTEVSFDENFTAPQLLELNNFIYENTYQNENIIQTDSMTLVEIQAAAQELYDQGLNVLERVSQPRYEIGLDSVNYTVLEDFQIFTDQTEVGVEVTCELNSGVYITVVLLEINIQFDDPSSFSLTFSNRLRLDNGNFTYSDLLGQVVKTGSSVSFDSASWSNWTSDYKDSVSTFITSSLDTTVNNLISNNLQEILINQNGLRARQSNGSGGYNAKQVWLVNNMLAFSDDGFQTAKLALGEISSPGGGTVFGLVADTIVGRLIAGNTLNISNSANNFILDQTGAYLNNASFNLQDGGTIAASKVHIVISPLGSTFAGISADPGITIMKNTGGTWSKTFWVDTSGNINFSGILSGATGTFTGTLSASIGNLGTLVIDSQGLKTSDGVNYLRGNGQLKWGGLTVNGTTTTFQGDIIATNLKGNLDWSNITNIPAEKITSGTMSGNRIFGGTGSFGSIVGVGGPLAVIGSLSVSGQIVNSSGSNSIWTNAGIVVAGSISASSVTALLSSTNGVTGNLVVLIPGGGSRTLRFSAGICYGLV